MHGNYECAFNSYHLTMGPLCPEFKTRVPPTSVQTALSMFCHIAKATCVACMPMPSCSFDPVDQGADHALRRRRIRYKLNVNAASTRQLHNELSLLFRDLHVFFVGVTI